MFVLALVVVLPFELLVRWSTGILEEDSNAPKSHGFVHFQRIWWFCFCWTPRPLLLCSSLLLQVGSEQKIQPSLFVYAENRMENTQNSTSSIRVIRRKNNKKKKKRNGKKSLAQENELFLVPCFGWNWKEHADICLLAWTEHSLHWLLIFFLNLGFYLNLSSSSSSSFSVIDIVSTAAI